MQTKTLPNQTTHNYNLFVGAIDISQAFNIRKWIKALRSGDYKQGKSTLYNEEENTYCCLGVAARVCHLGEANKDELYNTHYKMGLRHPSGSFDSADNTLSLTELNDSLGDQWTFTEIAQLLEDQLNLYKETGYNHDMQIPS